MDRANQGDTSAFDDLIVHVSSRLLAIAHRMISKYPHVRRWEETDDVLQESLLRLHRALKEVQPDSAAGFFGLAATLLRRTLIDLSRHYYGVYGLGARHHSGPNTTPQDVEAACEQLGQADPLNDLEDWTAFHEAIERLPRKEREVFGLLWYAGLTQLQAAEVLGVSQRTVIRRMNRARLLLNEMLSDSPLSND